MPRGKKSSNGKTVDSYTHDTEKRKNNPPVGLVSTVTDRLNGKTKYEHDPHIDPFLSWAGKKEGADIEVQNVSLHIHERIDPERIIKSVLKEKKEDEQLSLFEEPEQNLPLGKAVDFYRHDQGWSNRLIAGDSLLVMNSLLVKEGMAGKVQMIYIDPPYGIKYNSNFQPFVNKRDVKDGNDDDIPAEPEMIQAFRDTWELGIHSYLTYLRDRLLLARELLSESGSVFVQISDENVHHVREMCDEVFGRENFISQISFKKTVYQETDYIPNVYDIIIWYGKNKKNTKIRQLYIERDFESIVKSFDLVELKSGEIIKATKLDAIPPNANFLRASDLTSKGESDKGSLPFFFEGTEYSPKAGNHWKTHVKGLENLAAKKRLVAYGKTLCFKKYAADFPVTPFVNVWNDTIQSTFAPENIYVVQTYSKVITRCLLMTTDPGDLSLDITCGSGTTAFVAEQWGRRWITCDTSRVAITLAKQRLMTAKYDYYELAHQSEGIKSGLKYKTVPHITLKSIANNELPKLETLFDQPFIEKGKVRVTGPFTVEAVPSLRVKPIEGNINESIQDAAVLARSGETARFSEWMDELRVTGIRALGGKLIRVSRVEPMAGTRFLHAEAEILEDSGENKTAYISFGPDFGPLEQRQVEAAITEARAMKRKLSFLIFAAFHFDPEAAKDIDQAVLPGITLLKAQMSVDLLTADLRKKRSSSQSFWLIGQPDVEVKKHKDEKFTVKVKGFDYYNPVSGEIESKDTKQIAMWMLDTDYDERSLFPNQVFFPDGDEKRGWMRLAKSLQKEINEELMEKYTGVESIPFMAGENNKIAVIIIDNRGIESFVIKNLGE